MSQATVTAKTQGAQAVTTKVIANVRSFTYDFINQIVFITTLDDTRQEYDVSANTTTTLTYSAGNYTLTIS